MIFTVPSILGVFIPLFFETSKQLHSGRLECFAETPHLRVKSVDVKAAMHEADAPSRIRIQPANYVLVEQVLRLHGSMSDVFKDWLYVAKLGACYGCSFVCAMPTTHGNR